MFFYFKYTLDRWLVVHESPDLSTRHFSLTEQQSGVSHQDKAPLSVSQQTCESTLADEQQPHEADGGNKRRSDTTSRESLLCFNPSSDVVSHLIHDLLI